MDRWGCIRFPELPLQVALLRSGTEASFAVVRDDRPSSPLLYVNPAALDQGLRPGMRYTAALSIVPQLQVDTVSARELAEVRGRIVELLAEWSPQIEPCAFDAEVFWINASGLSALHGAPEVWGASLRDHLAGLGYRVNLVIGFSRRGSYVLVRSWRRSAVVARPEAERRAVAASPVAALPLPWPVLDLLGKLHVVTVASLDQIPPAELVRRLGRDALTNLQALNELPLQPAELAVPTVRELRWDDPVTDSDSLRHALQQLLTEVLDTLRPRARLVETLTFELLGESAIQTEVLKPAQPTSSLKTWLRLLELRLSSFSLAFGVLGVRLDTVSVPPPPPAADLFERPPRDLSKGEKALALIRARWGNESVVQALPADSHVPELSFVWQTAHRLMPPRPGRMGSTAVRRLLAEPRARAAGTVLAGPFVLRGIEPETGERFQRRYWFVRDGQEVVWMRQDGWSEPCAAAIVD